jgi:hypothetical protein
MTTTTRPTAPQVSTAAVGVSLAAGVLMFTVGLLHVVYGLSAVLSDEIFVRSGDYLYRLDLTAWGWIHLTAGAVVLAAGIGVMVGATWARVVGLVLMVLSLVANFASLPYYPFWSAVLIALNVLVIWALANYGRREALALGL